MEKIKELKKFLQQELDELNSIKKDLLPNSKLCNRIDGKIDAYKIILGGLN